MKYTVTFAYDAEVEAVNPEAALAHGRQQMLNDPDLAILMYHVETEPTDTTWEDDETDTCPEHGKQDVIGYSSTNGPDPYGVNQLKCGHWVVSYGPGEPNVIINHKPRSDVA